MHIVQIVGPDSCLLRIVEEFVREKPMHKGLKCPFHDISEPHLTFLAFLDRTFQGIPKMFRAGG